LETKECYRCKEIKPIEFFNKNKNSKDGHCSWCKVCINKYKKERYIKNRDEIKAQNAEYRKEHREQYLELFRKRHRENPEYNRNWRRNNKDKCREYCKRYARKYPQKMKAHRDKWLSKNREEARKLFRAYFHKASLNPRNRTSRAFSSRIRNSLFGGKNNNHWEDLVGYSLEDLSRHLEKQFEPGMTWGNYGRYGWHIDHIIPVSLWEFESYADREFKQCWALCNLQPLWAKDNFKKNKYI
jgi:hypothetical protein